MYSQYRKIAEKARASIDSIAGALEAAVSTGTEFPREKWQ